MASSAPIWQLVYLKRLRRETDSGRAVRVIEPSRGTRWKMVAGISAAVVVIAFLIAALLRTRSSLPSTGSSTAVTSPTQSSVRTLAVLPFRDLSGQSGGEVWGIGIADAIISRLATLQNLAVRPTNSVLKYVKGADDPEQAARELGVNSVLAGTNQHSGGVMRVSVQLIDHGVARWAERYDLQGHDMLRFEDDVAQRVVQGLSLQLTGQEQQSLKASSTNSAEAYNLLLQARAFFADYFINSQRETLHNAERMARLATEKDPTFVDAYAFLGHTYTLEATNYQDTGSQTLALAEKNARKAVALNPNSYEANFALGAVYAEQGNLTEGIRLLRQAVELAPNSSIVWKYFGYACHYAGLTDQAEAAFRRGRDLDPTPAQAYWMHGQMLLYQGKAHEAEEEVRRALERYPNQFKLLTTLGYFLYYEGKSDEAQLILDRALSANPEETDVEPMIISAIVHASRGERNRIDPRVFRYKPEEIVDGDLAEWIGAVYALLGDKESALGCLRQAVRRGNHNYPWYRRDKNWDKLRSDPEFQRIMSEVEGYWKHYVELFGQGSS